MEEPATRGVTDTYLQLKNESISPAKQLAQALQITRKNYGHMAADKLTEFSLGVILGSEDIKPTIGSARSFFFHRFPQEAIMAQEEGLPSEAVGNESGIWSIEAPVKGISEEEAMEIVNEGLKRAILANTYGLMKIFNQTKMGAFFNFENRLDKAHVNEWIQSITQNRVNPTPYEIENGKTVGDSFKEWGIDLNDDGDFVVRDPSHQGVDTLFQVAVVPKTELENELKLAEMIDDHLVAKIILMTDDDGKVTDVKMLFNHLNNDGEHGQRVFNQIIQSFDIDEEREITGTNVLRKFWVGEGEQRFVMVDLETSYQMASAEEKLYKMAIDSVNPKLNMSVLMSQAWLTVMGGESGYVCVAPNIERGGGVPAGLQMAFLPSIQKLNHFALMLEEALPTKKGKLPTSAEYLIGMAKRDGSLLNAITKLSNFMQAEIKRARAGMGTIGVLAAYVPDRAQRFFKFALNRQYGFVSGGTVQISSIIEKKLKQGKFVSALNATTNTSIGIFNLVDKKVVDLRFRTDAADYKEALNRIHRISPELIPHPDIVASMMKEIVEEKVKKYRIGLALMAMTIAIKNNKNLENVQEITDRVLTELRS